MMDIRMVFFKRGGLNSGVVCTTMEAQNPFTASGASSSLSINDFTCVQILCQQIILDWYSVGVCSIVFVSIVSTQMS